MASDREIENEMILRCNFYRRPKLAFLSLELSMRHSHGKQAHRCFVHVAHAPFEQPPAQVITRAAFDLLNFDLRPLIFQTDYRCP